MQYRPPPEGNSSDIADDVFDAVITARKLEEVAHIYGDAFFSDKDNDDPRLYMAAIIYDYAHKVCAELKNIEAKLI